METNQIESNGNSIIWETTHKLIYPYIVFIKEMLSTFGLGSIQKRALQGAVLTTRFQDNFSVAMGAAILMTLMHYDITMCLMSL